MPKKSVLIFTMILAACATTDVKHQKAKLYADVGRADLASGQYPEALQQLQIAYELDPEDPDILNDLGLAYFVRNKYTDALFYINKSLKNKPNFTEARNNLGRVLIDMGKYNEAIRELQTVTADLTYLTPEKGFANLGLAYLKKEDYENSKKYLVKAIQANREFCPAYNYYGQALFQTNNFEKAAKMFDRQVKICEKTSDEVQYFSALSYFKMGNRDKALARFEEIVKESPAGEFAQKSEAMIKIIREQ